MNRFQAMLDAGDRKPLWLDYSAYAAALLASGAAPWLDATATVAWLRKAQGLLKSDVVALPLPEICTAWLGAHPSLCQSMAAKRRAVAPLRALLADESLRALIVDLLRTQRAIFDQQPLALVCASPRRWVLDAYRMAFGTAAEVEVGDDEADSASVYIADFLRAFGDTGVDALLLQESVDSEPADAAGVVLYQSLLNVAVHYRWSCGLYAPGGRYAGGDAGLAFVIAPQATTGARAGALVADSFWQDGVAPACPPAGFRYARIPVDAQPERVLQQLASLR